MTDLVSPRARALAARVLLASALISMFAMAHHPTAHGVPPAELLRALIEKQALNAWVHGTLIALLLATTWALVELSAWRGLHRAPVRAAVLLQWTGVLAMIVAALVSGFLTTRIATRFVDAGAAGLEQARALLAAGWEVNQ